MSLRYRIAVVIFLLEAVMMAAVLWGTLGHAVDSAEKQIEAAEQVTLDIVSGIGRVALLTEDYDRIQGYIEALPANPGIIKAMLSDDRNIIVASSNLNDLGEYLPLLKDTETEHWKVDDIRNISGDLGILAVQFSDHARRASYDAAMQRGIAIAIAGMLLIAVIGIGIGFLLTARLARLSAAAEQVSKGNYDIRTNLRGRDEITQLGAAFDRMTATIASERQALANANLELETRVRERTQALETANEEYKSFAYAVSHDLRAPLRALAGFSQAIDEDYADQLDDTAKDYLQRINTSALKMNELIEGLLKLSRISRADINNDPFDLSHLCDEIISELQEQNPERTIEVTIQPGMTARGDKHLLRDVMANLIGNAWKFTVQADKPAIEVGARRVNGDSPVYFVRDNGAGFDADQNDKLFVPFQRLHNKNEFPGSGIGLSTVRKIILRHQGAVWAEGKAGGGATFYFTLHGPRPGDTFSGDEVR